MTMTVTIRYLANAISITAALAACTPKRSEPRASTPPQQPEVVPIRPPTTTASPEASLTPKVGDLGRVGKVEFKLDCDPSVQAEFDRGLALLHSFFYAEARKSFTSVTNKDPQCAI